jgi:DNA gyrase subunit B/topoisomerase-4 subunit B
MVIHGWIHPTTPQDPVKPKFKLDDCERHGPGSAAELLLVEGDSAAASVISVRDPVRQAVLCLQGKPLNAGRASPRRVAAHPLFRLVADAIGAPLGVAVDPARLRFERVLLLMDPDADGIHCGVLMLMFFYRWMLPLLDSGRVMMVRPPWGEIIAADAASPLLAFSDAEFQSLAAAHRDRPGTLIRRFRGLAGIDPGLLLKTCVNAGSRRAVSVQPAEVEAMTRFFGGLHSAEPPHNF